MDHERPLAPRGERAARLMGRFLSLANRPPEWILTSSALRARSTAILAASAGGWDAVVRETRGLYGASAEEALSEVAVVGEGVERLLIVGHEPMCSDLVKQLTGAEVSFVTAALALVEVPASTWSGLASRTGAQRGRLIFFVPPKIFTRGDFPFAKRKR